MAAFTGQDAGTQRESQSYFRVESVSGVYRPLHTTCREDGDLGAGVSQFRGDFANTKEY